MKVSRRHGQLRLRLDALESGLLAALLGELATALETEALGGDDPVHKRLFPAAYREDELASSEFRSLTESALRTERVERARRCARQLGDGATDVQLDAEAGEDWVRVLNDLRLTLGTRLGVTEDEAGIDPRDPEAEQRMIYGWLTAVQDSLVRALMR